MHLCFSGNPACSAPAPCVVCRRFITEKVLPRAMALAGPPFNADRNVAFSFMRAYAQALEEMTDYAKQIVAQPVKPEVQAPVPETGQPHMTEEEYLLHFQRSMLEGATHLTEEHKALIARGIREQTLEGWAQLNENERNIMRQIFCPDIFQPQVEVPEDAPMPSEESVHKVVEALRNGTLSPQTLAPEEAPKTSAEAAPAAEVKAPEEVLPQPPEEKVNAAGDNSVA
jgi:hypothetical protein